MPLTEVVAVVGFITFVHMKTIRERLRTVIFGTSTRAGKRFDIILLWLILLSIFTVLLESVPSLRESYGDLFFVVEWIFTILFTIEYFLRIYSSSTPKRYIFSFYGLVDVLAFLPTYLFFFFPALHYLVTIRAIRLLRIFRILKLLHFMANAQLLLRALRASFYKIIVFMTVVLAMVLIIGTVMYVVEGEENGFTSIPRSIYWAIVTISTVGYGDITPQTVTGQIISSFVMLLGYTIIAVPTGIVAVEFTRGRKQKHGKTTLACSSCGTVVDREDRFCRHCGEELL